MKLIGWHGNKQAWCRGLIFASPAPFLKILVRSEADPYSPAGRLAPQGVERPVHAGVQYEICSAHPVFKAHLRCAFLIMSGRHHVNASLSQMHCLRDGAGDHARR
jgi:hypothetical protein